MVHVVYMYLTYNICCKIRVTSGSGGGGVGKPGLLVVILERTVLHKSQCLKQAVDIDKNVETHQGLYKQATERVRTQSIVPAHCKKDIEGEQH